MVISSSRVSDNCQACEGLKKLVVNRSVLSLQENSSAHAKATVALGKPPHHKSVWKLAESSEAGCTFVCPQVQSFNTSLPGAFSPAKQAVAVVEHVVCIDGRDLAASVHLAGRTIDAAANMEDAGALAAYGRDKAVGPLLEWAASLRLCTGFSDQTLVSETRYLLSVSASLPAEARRLLARLSVDEDFRGKLTEDSSAGALLGTVRAPTCRFLATPHAEVCEQCRLLQEPGEALGL